MGLQFGGFQFAWVEGRFGHMKDELLKSVELRLVSELIKNSRRSE